MTTAPKQRLSPEDWIAAGFRALVRGGPAALRAEAIARDLSTTKGSFYWHFKDIAAYRTAMLELWKDLATEDIIARLQALPAGRSRLEALISEAQGAPERFGGHLVEPAIRHWSRHDAQAARYMAEVDARRMDWLRGEFAALGADADLSAHLLYAAYIGLEQLGPATAVATRADTLHGLLNHLLKGN